jgi:hypothetical protein
MTLTFLISKIRKKSGPKAGVVEAEAVAEGEEARLCENSAGVAAAQRAAVAGGDRPLEGAGAILCASRRGIAFSLRAIAAKCAGYGRSQPLLVRRGK